MYTEVEITAQDTWTDAVPIPATRIIDLSIGGTFVATVTIQRYIFGEWKDIEDYTAAAEKKIEGGLGRKYRAGVKTGNYTSGTVEIALHN